MDRFCKDECPYKRTEDCALPAVAEEILNGGDRVIGYFVSSLAIVGNGLSGMGDMNSAQYAHRAALARVAARREDRPVRQLPYRSGPIDGGKRIIVSRSSVVLCINGAIC